MQGPCTSLKRRTMQIFKRGLGILIIFAISGMGTTCAQSAIDKLQPLVETSARRLAIAKQLALAKWDSQAPVEDAARETRVITDAVKDGELRGLDRTFVVKFFAPQIEANQFIHYSLLSNWHRIGRAPAHRLINLATLRRELDRFQAGLIQDLVDTEPTRASSA